MSGIQRLLAHRWTAWSVLGLAALWLLATPWLRPYTLPDEGRYIGVAWEMLRSGDWLVPHQNGLPFFHKPPLFYWITAASLQVFGVTPWAGRMASFVGAMLAVGALYALLARRADRALARQGVLVLVTPAVSVHRLAVRQPGHAGGGLHHGGHRRSG